MSKKQLVFCTSNQEKVKDLQHILGEDFLVVNVSIDLAEIQGSPEEITLAKAKEAYRLLKKPLIVEDTCLCFNAFGGLPGPYIKYFLLNIGPQGLYKTLEKFEDKTGYALCTFGYADENDVKIFKGRVNGTIVEPRGKIDISWNSIFEPNGYDKTFSELSFEEKNKVSHRYRAAMELKVRSLL
ncbi:conserved hypothetical protein [Theileria equi strain WA]|uniref:XTP/dITP diphosphatase n=1 Tax=Theileria equi strain WA TaxID=1537102 RepID=L1LD23_THEEQ|nr:conserved hypothetical protein [Theileria equi strain WA]EKX73236.1 conserved hypothetical protein [Theileria equi strain WA]|eukprot:XP_004832688.1 conserved hypothetical protein [Theileria equi strain WA]